MHEEELSLQEKIDLVAHQTESAEVPALGTIVDHYQLEEKIGAGGFGLVYRAKDLALGRNVAIKILTGTGRFDRASLLRFKQEAQIYATLDHPNIAEIYDFGVHDEKPYIVMEYVHGRTLASWIHARGFLSAGEAIFIALKLADALKHAHRKGILHRDIKPSNIMVGNLDGDTLEVKLLDFGIAKQFSDESQSITTSGTIVGSVSYMSPEQAQGQQVNIQSEIYALGCVVYEMLSGKPPYEGEGLDVFAQHLTASYKKIEDNAEVSDSLNLVLETALSKDPGKRYADMDAFSAALRQVLPAKKIGYRQGFVFSNWLETTDGRTFALKLNAGFALVTCLCLLTFSAALMYTVMSSVDTRGMWYTSLMRAQDAQKHNDLKAAEHFAYKSLQAANGWDDNTKSERLEASYAMLAQILYKEKRFNEAQQMTDKAWQYAPKVPSILDEQQSDPDIQQMNLPQPDPAAGIPEIPMGKRTPKQNP